MPELRKVIAVGNSKGITLPSWWIKQVEQALGHKLRLVTVNGDGVLTVTPVKEEKV